MKRLFALLLCAGLFSCVSRTDQPKKATLVKDGQPQAVIVLPEKPTRTAQFAANELQGYLKAISGAELTIIKETETSPLYKIYVGDTATAKKLGLADFETQEYAVNFQDGALVLCGKDDQTFGNIRYDFNDTTKINWLPSIWSEVGTLYAVYDFLEQCGVRWINPLESGTIIPEQKTLAVSGKDVKRKPFFRYREIVPKKYDEALPMWGSRAPEFKEVFNLGYAGLKEQCSNDKQFEGERTKRNNLFALRSRLGGEMHQCNHSFEGYYVRFWEKDKDPRRAKHFEGFHPEYFAKGYEGKPPQMCYSSEALVKQVANEAREYFTGKVFYHCPKFRWGKDNFAIVPQDNQSYCRCEECIAYDKNHKPGEIVFDFVNRVAREVEKTNPGKRISMLAYANYMNIPSFPLEKNIDVHYCWATNRGPTFTKGYKEQLKGLKKWGALKNDGPPLYLWLYYTFPRETAENGRWYTFPGAFAHVIDQQFKLFRDLNVRGMFHCGYGQDVEGYVTNRLMNDPSLDIEVLLDEYFSMYGVAAKPIRKFYDLLEKRYQTQSNYPPGTERIYSFVHSWQSLGTDAVMKELAGYIAEAEKLAKTPQEKQAVAVWRKSIWDYMVRGKKEFIAKQEAPIPSLVSPKQKVNANGDVSKVDWQNSVPLAKWYRSGSSNPSLRPLSGRVTHDDTHLYLELTDPVDTSKLKTSATVFEYDDWEFFVGAQRSVPYRQYAFGPSGLIVAMALGEINMLRITRIEPTGIKVTPIVEKDKWISRAAFPLATIIEKPVKPGDTLYFSISRVENPQIEKVKFRNEVSTFVSFCMINDPDRFAELKLEK